MLDALFLNITSFYSLFIILMAVVIFAGIKVFVEVLGQLATTNEMIKKLKELKGEISVSI